MNSTQGEGSSKSQRAEARAGHFGVTLGQGSVVARVSLRPGCDRSSCQDEVFEEMRF